jgi:hypothetical protein
MRETLEPMRSNAVVTRRLIDVLGPQVERCNSNTPPEAHNLARNKRKKKRRAREKQKVEKKQQNTLENTAKGQQRHIRTCDHGLQPK